MAEMTRDEITTTLERIQKDADEMARLLADSGASPLRMINQGIGMRLRVVLDALRAEAHAPEMPALEALSDVVIPEWPEMPVLAAGDWLDLDGVGMACVPYAAGARTLQGCDTISAVYRAIWRRDDHARKVAPPEEMPVIEAGDDVIYRSEHAGQPDEEMSGLLMSEVEAWQDNPCVVGIRRTIWTRAEGVIPMDTLGDAYLHEQARIRECHSTRRWHLQRLRRERALKEMIHGDPVEEKR